MDVDVLCAAFVLLAYAAIKFSLKRFYRLRMLCRSVEFPYARHTFDLFSLLDSKEYVFLLRPRIIITCAFYESSGSLPSADSTNHSTHT